MTRLSTLMGVFALGAAAFFIYQAQQATARTAAPPAVDAMTAAAPKPAETATETTAETAEKTAEKKSRFGPLGKQPETFENPMFWRFPPDKRSRRQQNTT